ncbi:MAG: hypothetical protein M9927_07790 [Anaerolineae bacterium]|nr:hypothetical protein [Anaerolineae bacterium]
MGAVATYGYDRVGNRTSMVDALGTYSFTYDDLDQLASANQRAGQRDSSTYDLNDNRTSILPRQPDRGPRRPGPAASPP